MAILFLTILCFFPPLPSHRPRTAYDMLLILFSALPLFRLGQKMKPRTLINRYYIVIIP